MNNDKNAKTCRYNETTAHCEKCGLTDRLAMTLQLVCLAKREAARALQDAGLAQ